MLKRGAWALGASLLVACSPAPTPCYCESYVACFYKTGGTPGSLDSTYGANGSCWITTASVDACCMNCAAENAKLQMSGAAADAGCTFTPGPASG